MPRTPEQIRQYNSEWRKKWRQKPENRARDSAAASKYKKEKWYPKNKERYIQQVLEYRRRNPERAKTWAKKNNERIKAGGYKAQRKHHKKRIDWFREMKKGLKCSRCSESHPVCLDFHHRDPAEKSFHVGRAGRYRDRQALMAEIAKCDVLCNNCHRKLHYEERAALAVPAEALLDSVLAYQSRQRDWFMGLKNRYSCSQCGETHIACLDFHHLNPSKKEVSIGNRAHCMSKKRILREIKKCVCLCSNCHRKLHHEERRTKQQAAA